MPDFTTDIQAIADAAKNTIASIKAELATKKANRDSLLKQKETLALQPLAKEDIKQFIFDHIDNLAQVYLERGSMSTLIKTVAFPPRTIETDFPKPLNRAVNLYERDNGIRPYGKLHTYIFNVDKLPIFNGQQFSHGENDALYFFFGDVIKQKIDAHFDAYFPSDWDSYNPGLPLAQRRPLIAELDAQIADANAAIKELETHLRNLSLASKVRGD